MRFIGLPLPTFSPAATAAAGKDSAARHRSNTAPEGAAALHFLSLDGSLGGRTGKDCGLAVPDHLVRRAVEIACANSACIAAVMSPSVVTVKNMPVEAQLCRFGLIWFWYGATQLLYQELVVSGRYSVYSTAI